MNTTCAAIGRRVCGTSLLLAALSMLAHGAPASPGGNPFKAVRSTADGCSTWDSDLINIENVSQTGKGVYVAVLDSGLVSNWRDYFPEERIATQLGTGFDQSVIFKLGPRYPCGAGAEVGRLRQTTWVGSVGSTHGTHVISTIIGYSYQSNADAAAGFPLPPIMIRGIAPEVTIIPVKVLADYQVPAMPKCGNVGPVPAQNAVFGTSEMIAAGILYATDLAMAGYRPMVISMSLGGPALDPLEQGAIDWAIANGVIVVAAAGNEGKAGMDYPGAYAPVISVGSAGWTGEWLPIFDDQYYRLWWLQSGFYPYNDIAEPTPDGEVYVSDFSSRELAGQQLDVLAPGSWVRGPFPSGPGYSHLPWWSNGLADLIKRNLANFYYLGGTSMATPHVASVAALMLQKNPDLTQARVESILKSTALTISSRSAIVFDPTVPGWTTPSWDSKATGAGLIQADVALKAVPPVP